MKRKEMAKSPLDKVFEQKVLRVLVISTAYIGLIYIAFLLRRPLVWLAIAFFLALAMEPAVQWLQRRLALKSRAPAALLLIVSILAVVVLVLAVLIPPLVKQTESFVHSVPSYIEKLQLSNNGTAKYLSNHGELTKVNLNSQKLLEQVSNHRDFFLGTASSIASVATEVVTILVLTFFIILELPQMSKTFWRYQPSSKRKHRLELGARMHKVVTGSVNGNMLTSLIAGVSASIVLAILHIPYAIPLGVLVALIDLIPEVGASLGAIVVIIATILYSGPAKAIIIAVYFFIYQRIENNTLQPLVYNRTVHISPLLSLFAVVCGAKLGGLVGVLFAIPVTGILQILVKDYLENHSQAYK